MVLIVDVDESHEFVVEDFLPLEIHDSILDRLSRSGLFLACLIHCSVPTQRKQLVKILNDEIKKKVITLFTFKKHSFNDKL